MRSPKIRFRDNEIDWNNYQLKELANRFDNLRIPVKESDREIGTTPYYGANGIQGYIKGCTHDGEFLLIAEDGANDLVNYPVQYVNGKIWVNNHAHVIQAIEGKANNLFLKYAISVADVKSLLVGGGRSKLNADVLMKLELKIPSIIEQKQISSFCENIDSLIIHNRNKLLSLKQIKSACLQSMFPQEGESVPKIRFKGFDKKWERCNLSDIAIFRKGKGYSKSDIESHGTPIILYGSLYTNYNLKISEINSFVHEKVGSYKSEGNEIIVPASGETAEDIARASVVAQKGVILGGDLNIISIDKNSFSPEFVALSITYGQPHKYLTKVAQGKSVVHLHNSDISKICLLCPSLEEQQKIAAYFENLDKQISLQTQRLEKLKQIKSACLDKMFV